MKSIEEDLKAIVRTIPDFPKPGIAFKDITPVLSDAYLCGEIVFDMDLSLQGKNIQIDAVAGIESRGFFFGFLLANKLGVPFIPIRKPGKLPFTTVSMEYDLEYGSAKIEMNSDAVSPGMNVLIHDDLLATGGTAEAASKLIKSVGGNVAAFWFLITLNELKGREKLAQYSENFFSSMEC